MLILNFQQRIVSVNCLHFRFPFEFFFTHSKSTLFPLPLHPVRLLSSIRLFHFTSFSFIHPSLAKQKMTEPSSSSSLPSDVLLSFSKMNLNETIDQLKKKLPQVTGADPVSCPLDIYRLWIVQHLQLFAPTLTPDYLFSIIEEPKKVDLADLAVPAPKLKLPGNPIDLAKEIAEKFQPNDYISYSFASGPFINFTLTTYPFYQRILSQVYDQQETYGTNQSGEQLKAVIEFSSPNIAKPFHAGHLRSTILGNFVRLVLKANGWQTTALNYLGDWGKQYGLLAVGFDKFGNEQQLVEDPIHHLFDVYVKINEAATEDPSLHDQARAYFKLMEDNDTEALKLWQRFRDLSIKQYQLMYQRLGIQFDEYSGESQVSQGMTEVMEYMETNQLLEQREGAWFMNLEPEKLGMAMLRKSDGTTLYLTRDAGAAKLRYERFKFDRMYYVVGTPQTYHFQQLFCILNKLKFEWSNQCHFIGFGNIAGMSTRKGQVVFLKDILDHAKERVLEIMQTNQEKYAELESPEQTADLIGISAIVVQDMCSKRIKGYTFDWKRMLNFEGDTGPYLQYAHARLSSIERKVFDAMQPQFTSTSSMSNNNPWMASNFLTLYPSFQVHLLTEPEVKPLVFLLARFPDLIRELPLHHQFEPCHLVSYLFQLCRQVSSVLEKLYVMNQEKEVQLARLRLYSCARITLGNGLRLLGLTPLTKM